MLAKLDQAQTAGLDEVRTLLKARDFNALGAAANALRQAEPGNAEAHFLCSVAALETRRFNDALTLLQDALALDPTNPAYLAQLARCYVMTGQTDAGLSAARKAFATEPSDALTLDTLGVVFSHAHEHTDAAAVFRLAVRQNPHNAHYLSNLGTSLKFSGDLEGAEQAFGKALATDKNMHRVHFAIANLRHYSKTDNHIGRLKDQLQNFTGTLEDRMYIGYALAKELDDCGAYEEAFETLTASNAAWRDTHPYDAAHNEQLFEALTQQFDRAFTRLPTTSCAAPDPIFVFGMPRTGTTLTERIISSHSEVRSAGELTHFARLCSQLSGSHDKIGLKARNVPALGMIAPGKLGQAYIDSVRTAPHKQPRFIDKLPVNFLYAGLIMKALPNAKIVCVLRNPLDTCLSNFRQLFAFDNPFYTYSNDILDCGRYYIGFRRLLTHWADVFPNRIHFVTYEELVTDQETQSRRVLEHCGLKWEEACLNFELNEAAVATASAAQVREPIYTSALARWKNYREALKPLAELLDAHGIQTGYFN